MTLIISPAALEEADEAAAYLDRQRDRLGDVFYSEFNQSLEKIKEAPRRWPLVGRDIRRYRTSRFKYLLIYRELDGDQLELIAVAHPARRPGYWRDRLG